MTVDTVSVYKCTVPFDKTGVRVSGFLIFVMTAKIDLWQSLRSNDSQDNGPAKHCALPCFPRQGGNGM